MKASHKKCHEKRLKYCPYILIGKPRQKLALKAESFNRFPSITIIDLKKSDSIPSTCLLAAGKQPLASGRQEKNSLLSRLQGSNGKERRKRRRCFLEHDFREMSVCRLILPFPMMHTDRRQNFVRNRYHSSFLFCCLLPFSINGIIHWHENKTKKSKCYVL